MPSTPLLSWQAPEFIKYKKGKLWFVIFFLVSAFLVFVAFHWKSITMLFFLLFATFVAFIYSLKTPRLLNIAIKKTGVQVEDVFYPFSDIRAFWILYEPPEVKDLILQLKKQAFFPNVFIPLGDTDPTKVRSLLLHYLPEQKLEESLFDILARKLRF